MLGKTAGGLYWMFRYLERCENTARLLDAGARINMTRADRNHSNWRSVLETASAQNLYDAHHEDVTAVQVIDFLLRSKNNSSSVISSINQARQNARLVRTALSREVWEAVNESWMAMTEALARKLEERDLPEALNTIRKQIALVRGAVHGTLLRNDVYDFVLVGMFMERGESVARILDARFTALLPGSSRMTLQRDNIQREAILRAVSGQRGYRWTHGGDINAHDIADFLILDRRMPRSLIFCASRVRDNLAHLEDQYGERHPCHETSGALVERLRGCVIQDVIDGGLHDFIRDFTATNVTLNDEIETAYRFYAS